MDKTEKHSFHHEVTNVESFKQKLDTLLVHYKCILHTFEEKKEVDGQFNVHFELEGSPEAISEVAKAIADLRA